MYRKIYCLFNRDQSISDKNNVFNFHTNNLGNT